MLRSRVAVALGFLLFGCVLLPSWTVAGKAYPSAEARKVTWADAPTIAKQLKFTLGEARSLFTEDELAHLAFANKDEPHRIQGGWRVTRPVYRNGQAVGGNEVDREFRPGGNTPRSNPAAITVDSQYKYAPPLGPEEAHLRRYVNINVRVKANSAHAEAKRIEYLRSLKAESRAEQRAKPHPDYTYFHEKDLGFGIRRNEAYGDLRKDGSGCRVTVDLASEQHFASVNVFVTMEGKAVSQKRVMHIAKGTAAILCNKIWGTQVKVAGAQRAPVGISDVWLTMRPGSSPEEDRHVDHVKLGGTVYLAVTHRPPVGENPVRVNVWLRPGQDAVAASRERIATRETSGVSCQ